MKTDRCQSGQAMAFGAITLFLVTCFVAFVFNVAQASTRKLQIQHAADEGAYAGAVALADVVSEIAWLSDAQAHLAYHAMRQAVDVVVYGTLAELAEHPYSSAAVVGIPDAVERYDRAYAEAGTWFPRYDLWSRRLGQMQWALAAAAPALVRRESFKAIHETMGIDPATGDPSLQVAIFPDFELLPSPDGEYRLDITRYEEDPAGWRLEGSDSLWVEVRITDPNEWRVTSSLGLDLTVAHPTDTQYVLSGSSIPDGPMTFDFYPGFGWVLAMPGFSIQPGPNGGYQIQGEGPPREFRRGPDGQLQEFTGGAWQDLGGGSVVVDGVEIPVEENGLQIGQDTWVDFNPLRIRFNNITITPTGTNLRIEGQFGPAQVTVDNDYVVVNGLTTRSADGVWYRYGSDRVRHRMRLGEYANTWIYEWERTGGYMRVEPNRRRFAFGHAIRDNDPAGGSVLPAWAYDENDNPEGWFDPTTGRTLNDKAYHQTRPCWNGLDANCPVHGGDCGGLDGGWHEIRGIPPDTWIEWVECPVCTAPESGDALDDDGDGLSDVRKFQQYSYDRQGPGQPPPRYQSAQLVGQPFPGQLDGELRIPLPLVLTENFFKYGINIAVWKQADAAGGAGQEFRMLPGTFQLPAGFTGRVAFASAKCGFFDSALGAYRYRFGSSGEREAWIDGGEHNLYTADWQARLWSVADAILDTDIRAESSDSGLQYLFRGMLSTAWLTRYDDRQPTWGLPGGMGLDLLDPKLKDVVRH